MNLQGKNAIDYVLAESFKELAAVKAIEKITIREITDRAEVIRPTFYNHFQDKYELLEWIMRRELIDPMKPLIAEGRLRDAVMSALEKMQEDRAFYLKAVQLEGQNSFAETLVACIKELILEHVSPQKLRGLADYEWLTPETAADYYAHQINYIVMTWGRGGMRYEPAELTEALFYVMTHSPVEIFQMLAPPVQRT